MDLFVVKFVILAFFFGSLDSKFISLLLKVGRQ